MDRRKTLLTYPHPVKVLFDGDVAHQTVLRPACRQDTESYAEPEHAWAVKDEHNGYNKTNQCITLLSFNQILMLVPWSQYLKYICSAAAGFLRGAFIQGRTSGSIS